MVDRHTVFADRVLGVEGITPWKGGLIATAAPDILYLRDTDGDHRADVRERLYTGFALAHVEVKVSNPRLGLDNWFYVANHGIPGTVTSPSRPDEEAVNIRNREFRFHPLRNLAEPATGDAQFGHDSNEWGHWFIAHNTVHLRHTVIPSGYLGRNPFLAMESTAQDISDHGRPASSLFPISQPQQWRIDRTEARQRRYAETRPDREERLAGFFTAACGSTVYIGDAFPADLKGSVFVGEGNGNLVHCDLLSRDGATYSAARWPPDSEFLASTDNWFKPVNFSNAPDGNLYVIDYYRQYLEHPLFIPDSVKKRLRMDFHAGSDLGRIYRIVPRSPVAERQPPRLGSATTAELAQTLAHSNGWHRRTAHRLLIERGDPSAAKRIREMAENHERPEVRLRALWVLEGLGSLEPDVVEGALEDPHPAVRENALRLAETFGNRLSANLLAAHLDDDARVAFQAALSIGQLPVSPDSIRALSTLLSRFADDRWFATAVMAAPPQTAVAVLASLAHHHGDFFASPTGERRGYVRSVARTVGAVRASDGIDRLLGLLADASPLAPERWRLAALEGLAEGLALGEGRPITGRTPSTENITRLLGDRSGAVRMAAAGAARHFDLSQEIRRAKEIAMDASTPPLERQMATLILQGGAFGDVEPALTELLQSSNDAETRLAVVRALGSFAEPRAAETLLRAWTGAGPAARDAIAETMIRRVGHAAALLRAVADSRIDPSHVPAVTRIRLWEHPDADIREAARANLPPRARPRDEAVAQHLPALRLDGQAERGRSIFDRECADCHLAGGSRRRIGPDLAGVSNRSKEDLLTSILDPSYAIEDRYRNHLAFTTDGRLLDGILVAESDATVTLRGEASDVTILKGDIAELRASDVSMMPEGLEDAVTMQELADLIAFLQAGL